MAKRFKKTRYALGVQAIGKRPTPNDPTVGRDIANVGTATATGAAQGFAAGGPVGAIIGGGVGLITSGIEAIGGNKKRKEANEAAEQLFREETVAALQTRIEDPATQVEQPRQVKDGDASTSAEQIEVEKDELVFTKTSTGKYILKADFKGGKTHNKGGEDFTAAEGDIIFPGKDRKKVLKAFNSQDYPSLEAMRVSLPKDTDNGLAQDGRDHKDPPAKKDRFSFNLADIFGGSDEVSKFLTSAFKGFDPTGQSSGQNFFGSNKPGENKSFNERPINTDFSDIDEKPLTSVSKPTTARVASTTPQVDPRIASRERTAIPTVGVDTLKLMSEQNEALANLTTQVGTPEITGVDVPELSSGQKRFKNITGKLDTLKSGLGDISGSFGNIAQFGAAVTNLFPGEAEIESSPGVNLATVKHRDTSAGLREEANINAKIQSSNARNLAGGNIQNALANQRLSGVNKLRDLQRINDIEFGRASTVAEGNVGIINEERLINAKIKRADKLANQQNRAARRSSIRKGISQIGELGGLIASDRKKEATQNKLLETLNSLTGFGRDKSGKITLKR